MIAVSLEMVAVSVGADLRDGAAGAIVTGVSTDSRTLNRGDLFVPIRGPRFDGHAFVAQAVERGAAGVLVDQRYDCEAAARRSVPYMVVDDTTAALGRLAAAFRRDVMPASTTVVAVTGSNGKTTTKRMIDHVLRGSMRGRCSPRSFNNAIGVPLTLLSAEQSDRYLVVEIGSNAPGEVAALAAMAAPNVGVITSVGEAHLERFHDLHGVVVEKTSLLEHVAPTGLCVVNADGPAMGSFLSAHDDNRVLTVGQASESDVRVSDVFGSLDETGFLLRDSAEWSVATAGASPRGVMTAARGAAGAAKRRSARSIRVVVPIPGLHHAANAAAAYAVARSFGVSPGQIVDRLASFEPLVGRCQVRRLCGITIVDDSYNANPASMIAAVATLATVDDGRRVFVMGDMGELGTASGRFHREAVEAVAGTGIDVLITVGPDFANAARSQRDVDGIRRVVCSEPREGPSAVLDEVREGDTVWIKGSRSMALERVADALAARYGESVATAPVS